MSPTKPTAVRVSVASTNKAQLQALRRADQPTALHPREDRVGGHGLNAVGVYGLDVAALAEWITAIPLTEWPAGSHTELRPCMVTDLQWHGIMHKWLELTFTSCGEK